MHKPWRSHDHHQHVQVGKMLRHGRRGGPKRLVKEAEEVLPALPDAVAEVTAGLEMGSESAPVAEA